ncbi:uncharacterized protein LOC126891268 [Diabrotica virgifera virgifera]|uniref:HAT C-terminal dimerisation domain-containing protein n=1 Tax=Diabrotica virgifera virgifera TaxID=50390 RepID=A0ABM5L1U2_DIAVI|nr:uncharacterized protein LOC126891268 [Diabrotica virgifera virgifera]
MSDSNSGSATETDQNQLGPSSSSAKRKKVYKQHFKKDWVKLPGYHWVECSKKGTMYAWCKICRCDINITAGKVQLSKHSESSKHIKSVQNIEANSGRQQNIADMFSASTSKLNVEENVKEGIIRTAGLLAEHNLPMNLMEHLIDYLNAVCKDSEIAKKIKAGRTKITRVLKKVTGTSQKTYLIELMKTKKFSLIADESTDNSCIKHMCLVVRMAIDHKVEDNFLDLIPVVETTGAVLYEKIINFFTKHDIPYKTNFIGFASDGASNMVGIRNSLVSRLQENIPGIFTVKCICHSFHLCASYACKKLPEEVEQLTREVYNFFANSPKRVEELKEFQEFVNVAPAKILHPSQTRWLSLESVIKRLLNQYNALKLYFVDQVANNITQADLILEKLNKEENRLYLEFLSHALPIFNDLNKLMQSESPKIHILYKEITNTLKIILDFYMKSDIISTESIDKIDFKNPRNFLQLDDMYFSAEINSSSLDKNRLEKVKLNCLNFYIESVQQICSRFPLKDSLFEKMEFMDPEVIRSRKIRSIGHISKLCPNLFNVDIQTIDNEWLALRNFVIDFKDEYNDICEFWKYIASIKTPDHNGLRFSNLTNFVFNLLTLPVSSATVERVFSVVNLNKTKQRNRLKTSTLTAILHTKSLVNKNKAICSNFLIPKEMIKKLNQNIYDSDSD